jgi:signal recognition particle GTPase
MEGNEIIKSRIAGSSVRAIAKACGSSVAEVNRVIDRWAETTVSSELRKQTLALELARLDLQAFFTRAMTGDVQCGAPVTKII